MKVKTILKTVSLFAVLGAAEFAFAGPGGGSNTGIGGVAAQIAASFGSLAQLITASSYVGGLGFAISAILKFKAHKDNPTQIPVGTPIALVFISAALLFSPSIFKTAGETLYSGGGTVAGISGITSFTS